MHTMASRAATRLSIAERVEVVKIFFSCGRNAAETARKFAELRTRQFPLARSTVLNIVRKFERNGSLHQQKGSGRKPTITSEQRSRLLSAVRMFPDRSSRQLARETSISAASVLRILKMNGYKSFVTRKVQQMRLNDIEKRESFCDWLINQDNPRNILFTDECVFYTNGSVHKPRTWAIENPRKILPCRTQGAAKVNVWAGIIDTTIIGPFFFERNINGMLCFLYPRFRQNTANW